MRQEISNWLVAAIFMAMLPLHGAAQSASISIEDSEDFTVKAGQEKEMVISLTNPDDQITLVQFDLRLPDGLTLKMEDGDYAYDIAGRTTWKKHSLNANAQADGSIRFLLASSSNATLTGNSGAIITTTLVANSSFSTGTIKLENILMVTPAEKEIRQNTYSVIVNPTPNTKNTSLTIEQFGMTSENGVKTANLTIGMNNPSDMITLVQFDLRLTGGMSLKIKDGDYACDIAGRTTWRKHSLDVNKNHGVYRFLFSSASNEVFSGNEGAIINLQIDVDDSFDQGVYLCLENILLVTPEEKEIKPADLMLHVGRAGDVNYDGVVDVADIASIISMMAGNTNN